MLAKVMALAVSMLALAAAPSQAGHAVFNCGFNTISQATLTGGQDTFTGFAYGYVVSDTPLQGVSIRCFIEVNGVEYPGASTNLGAGTQATATNGPVTYTALDTDDVDLCAEWTAGSESGITCEETWTTQVPPQEVIDLAFQLADQAFELTCVALDVAYAGVPGVLEIRPGGDIYVLNELFYDCP